MNKQDIDVYVLSKEGIYLYDAPQHQLIPVAEGDFRAEVLTDRSVGRDGRLSESRAGTEIKRFKLVRAGSLLSYDRGFKLVA